MQEEYLKDFSKQNTVSVFARHGFWCLNPVTVCKNHTRATDSDNTFRSPEALNNVIRKYLKDCWRYSPPAPRVSGCLIFSGVGMEPTCANVCCMLRVLKLD